MKINKKLLITLLVGIMALTLVNALGLMAFYGQVNTNIAVEQPISMAYAVDGSWVTFPDNIFTEELEAMAGEEIQGAQIQISNSAESDKTIRILEVGSVEGIETDYGEITCYLFSGMGGGGGSIIKGIPVTIPAESHCSFYISYNTTNLLESGTYTITTNIAPTISIIPAP